jgi:hypothetical protein
VRAACSLLVARRAQQPLKAPCGLRLAAWPCPACGPGAWGTHVLDIAHQITGYGVLGHLGRRRGVWRALAGFRKAFKAVATASGWQPDMPELGAVAAAAAAAAGAAGAALSFSPFGGGADSESTRGDMRCVYRTLDLLQRAFTQVIAAAEGSRNSGLLLSRSP